MSEKWENSITNISKDALKFRYLGESAEAAQVLKLTVMIRTLITITGWIYHDIVNL